MLALLLVVLCPFGVVALQPAESMAQQWAAFKLHFKRAYSANEDASRFLVFKENLEYIHTENQKNRSYILGITPFTDLSAEEFQRRMLKGYRASSNGHTMKDANATHSTVDTSALPSSIDWVKRGYVTPVQNENMPPDGYGACWAFGGIGALESAFAIARNQTPIKLSEQQVVDCSGGGTCESGGDYDKVFSWALHEDICTELSYPYTCKTRPSGCQQSKCAVGLPTGMVSSYEAVDHNEAAVMAAVAQQPVVVAVAGAVHFQGHPHPAFQHYKGGILDNPDCASPDHAVLIVGYGTQSESEGYGGQSDSGNYWLIKNSYGTDWGVQGYLYLKRGAATSSQSSCGVPANPMYPRVRSPSGSTAVHVV